jgi:hypothetical protein
MDTFLPHAMLAPRAGRPPRHGDRFGSPEGLSALNNRSTGHSLPPRPDSVSAVGLGWWLPVTEGS